MASETEGPGARYAGGRATCSTRARAAPIRRTPPAAYLVRGAGDSCGCHCGAGARPAVRPRARPMTPLGEKGGVHSAPRSTRSPRAHRALPRAGAREPIAGPFSCGQPQPHGPGWAGRRSPSPGWATRPPAPIRGCQARKCGGGARGRRPCVGSPAPPCKLGRQGGHRPEQPIPREGERLVLERPREEFLAEVTSPAATAPFCAAASVDCATPPDCGFDRGCHGRGRGLTSCGRPWAPPGPSSRHRQSRARQSQGCAGGADVQARCRAAAKATASGAVAAVRAEL